MMIIRQQCLQDGKIRMLQPCYDTLKLQAGPRGIGPGK